MNTRNFENRYYDKLHDRPHRPRKKGRAATLSGAVKAAFKRVLDREYDKAMVYDPIGGTQFVVRRINSRVVTVTRGF